MLETRCSDVLLSSELESTGKTIYTGRIREGSLYCIPSVSIKNAVVRETFPFLQTSEQLDK